MPCPHGTRPCPTPDPTHPLAKPHFLPDPTTKPWTHCRSWPAYLDRGVVVYPSSPVLEFQNWIATGSAMFAAQIVATSPTRRKQNLGKCCKSPGKGPIRDLVTFSPMMTSPAGHRYGRRAHSRRVGRQRVARIGPWYGDAMTRWRFRLVYRAHRCLTLESSGWQGPQAGWLCRLHPPLGGLRPGGGVLWS